MTAPAAEPLASAPQTWRDAVLAGALVSVDPAGCGGLWIRARAGAVRDRFLASLHDRNVLGRPMVKMPPGATDDRLLGGLDLTRTLALGRPVLEPGLLSRADGGFLLVACAERLHNTHAARIAAAFDKRVVAIERDGLTGTLPADFALVLLDESAEPDEAPPQSLLDRIAFWIDLEGIPQGQASTAASDLDQIRRAAAGIADVETDDAAIVALCETAEALGIASQRAPYLAARAARASAALAGRGAVTQDDLECAVRLVLAPRATRFPLQQPEPDADPEPEQNPFDDQQETPQSNPAEVPLEVLLAAAAAVLPPGLLDGALPPGRPAGSQAGKSGRATKAPARGRRIGVRAGTLGGSARLDLVATLRAAAPFQSLRRSERQRAGRQPHHAGQILIERQDIRLARYEQRSETLTVFVVDASGSSAVNRLAEAKGAVELLLAECYARRDWVSLVAFRATSATLLLPPTRSLTRAKRCLEALPGGGGTPLASGLSAALAIAQAATRQGRTATTVVLTDGRANIDRDGKPGRAAAEADALAVAKAFAAAAERTLLIDIAPRPQPFSQRLASAMRGRYVPLPHADSAQLSSTVRAAVEATRC